MRIPRPLKVKLEPQLRLVILHARLSGEPHRRVGRAKQIVILALYDFKEEAVLEILSVYLQKFAVVDAASSPFVVVPGEVFFMEFSDDVDGSLIATDEPLPEFW